jgi:hypothetical protein
VNNFLNIVVEAATPKPPPTFQLTAPPGALTEIGTIISAGVSLILIVAGLIAFVYLLLGGIKWITSGGDSAAVEAARGQIVQALIGLIVVFASWGLIILVEQMTNVCLGFSCAFDIPSFR